MPKFPRSSKLDLDFGGRLLRLLGHGRLRRLANALMTKEYGISPVRAGTILAVFGVGAVISRPLLGLVRDFLGTAQPKSRQGCMVFTPHVRRFAVKYAFGQLDQFVTHRNEQVRMDAWAMRRTSRMLRCSWLQARRSTSQA